MRERERKKERKKERERERKIERERERKREREREREKRKRYGEIDWESGVGRGLGESFCESLGRDGFGRIGIGRRVGSKDIYQGGIGRERERLGERRIGRGGMDFSLAKQSSRTCHMQQIPGPHGCVLQICLHHCLQIPWRFCARSDYSLTRGNEVEKRYET